MSADPRFRITGKGAGGLHLRPLLTGARLPIWVLSGNADRFSRTDMFAKPIELWDAVITAIHHKVEDGILQIRILVSGSLNPELADILGTRNLVFNDNGTPKGGYSKLQLDTGCAAFRAVFEANPALKQSVELVSGDSTDRYCVERQADGVLGLKLRLNYHGDPHQLLAYVQAVGSGESVLKITPLQTAIEPEPEVKITKETVRQALASSRPRATKRGTAIQ